MKVTPNPNAFKRLRKLSDALKITNGDLAGPVLIRLGQVHRKQETAIFATEGAIGAFGKWPMLNPRYAKRKRRVVGRRKILVLTGDTKGRFTKASSPYYIQRFSPTAEGKGIYQFGAASDVAAAHVHGNPGLAPLRSSVAGLVFGGKANRLPIRNMITKTAQQVAEIKTRLVDWYRKERIPQVLRHLGKR